MEDPAHSVQPPSCNLYTVLNYLRSAYEPLFILSLRHLSKSSFSFVFRQELMVGELQVLSWVFSFSSASASVSYIPEFLPKTESALRPLPRSFLVKSLGFCNGLDVDLLLCPVRCLREYVSGLMVLIIVRRVFCVSLKSVLGLWRKAH